MPKRVVSIFERHEFHIVTESQKPEHVVVSSFAEWMFSIFEPNIYKHNHIYVYVYIYMAYLINYQSQIISFRADYNFVCTTS